MRAVLLGLGLHLAAAGRTVRGAVGVAAGRWSAAGRGGGWVRESAAARRCRTRASAGP